MYAPIFVLLTACLIVSRSYGFGYGDNISCWGRAEWADAWLHYVNAYCFQSPTRFPSLLKITNVGYPFTS